MLQRESGVALQGLASATSWLPHTTRAALTGLRKKGYAIEKRKRGEVSCYHLDVFDAAGASFVAVTQRSTPPPAWGG
jgi:hypothetical protein